jgi:hypothetical protein
VAVFTPLASGNAGEVTQDRPPSQSILPSALWSLALALLLPFLTRAHHVGGLGFAGYSAFLDLGLGWAGLGFTAAWCSCF